TAPSALATLIGQRERTFGFCSDFGVFEGDCGHKWHSPIVRIRREGSWDMPPEVLPTLQEIRKRVITDLVDADIRHAMRRPVSRRTRLTRAFRRHARRIIG